MAEFAVRISNLGFYYRPGKWILRDLNVCLARRAVLAVLGPNGRGKTTFLKLLLGALKPREGEVAMEGALPSSRNFSRRASTTALSTWS